MKTISINSKKAKYYAFTIFGVLIVIFLISGYFIGYGNSFGGILMGLIFFTISYLVKFKIKGERVNLKKNYGLLIFPIILVLVITYTFYSAFTMDKEGEFHEGKVKNVEFRLEQTGGSYSEGTATVIPVYYCILNNYPSKIQCNKTIKVGDKVRYFYAKSLVNSSVQTPAFIVKSNTSKFEAILQYAGAIFLGSIIYVTSFFIFWFASLFNRGVILLNQKNTNETVIMKFTYTSFYLLSFITFVLFIIVFFKNIYLIFYQKYWNLTFTTLALLTILISDIAERLFVFSTNLILELKSYKIVKHVKNIIKITGYISFLLLLLSSLIRNDKNILDLIYDFIDKNFELSIKSLFEFFQKKNKN